MSLPLVCLYHTNPVHFFDDKTRKPCIGQCGHTVCLECITDRRFTTCPFCGLNGAFSEETSVNYTSIALIEDCRKRFWEKWRGWMETKTPDAGFSLKLFEEARLLCSICVDPVKIPRICLTCDHETLFKLNRWQFEHYNTLVHKLLQRVMCSNCAIDNHEEKGHTIVKQEINKHSKRMITMAIAMKVLNMFKDAIENKRGLIDCPLRRMEIKIVGVYVIDILGELEYVEKWECGYLGELIKKELIKKYFENIDKKMLELFSTEGSSVCNCSRIPEDLETFSREFVDVEIHTYVGINPQVFDSGCPLYSWDYERWKCWKSEKKFSDVAATISPSDLNCPLCVYKGYSQHQRKDFLLECGVSIIEEFCKTEMIPLDKCCLNCLDRLNDCQLLFSCEHQKKKHQSALTRFPDRMFTDWYFDNYVSCFIHREKEWSKNQKGCYQNCFMKDTTLWNFVIINHMMADNNLYEVMMYEIEQTDGFVDCQLQKVRMKETISELYEGLHCVRFWECFDHLSKPIEMAALFNSFKQQWKSFQFGSGEQKAASQCKCTEIWNKVLESKMDMTKYEDLESKLIDMTRYSMTEEIHGCPMEYDHGIVLSKNAIEELEDFVRFESTERETEMTLVGDEEFKCMMKRVVSNIFPFAHLHCENEEKQLFDNKVHQPYTGSCGHTICLVCIEATINGDCPVCGKGGSFEGSQLDGDLLRENEKIKQNAWEMFKELWNCEAANSGTCSKCNKSSSDLHLCDINFNDFTIGTTWRNFFRMNTTADVLKLSRHVLCEECASVQAYASRKVTSISFWKNHLKKANGIFLLELIEDDIGGENCQSRQVEIHKNRKQLIKVLEDLNYEEKQECGYDRELIQLKLIEKLIAHLDRNAKQQPPIKEKNCPLCVMIDFLNCAENTSKSNRHKWMDVFENSWDIQSPRFEKCCVRCLLYLNNRYSASCQTETEVVNIRRISSAISEGIEKGRLRNFDRVLTYMQCNDRIYIKDDKEIWQNLIIREYFFCLLQTMTKGLSRTTFTCHLRKIRIHNLVYHLLLEFHEAWSKSNQYWTVCWKFFKSSSMIKNLNLQFKKLRDEVNKEKIGFKCKCTEIWKRNQKMMRKFGHEYCEEKRRHQDLEDSMEEMARFSLEEDLDGCPMDYDHGFVLDEEIVKKLKESTDLEAETDKKKCLCVQIDSLEPNSSISETNLHQIVPLFINWCKYESSYSHLLCHVCVDRLKLIQDLIWQLVLSNNWSSSVLDKLSKLYASVHDFQFTEGRVSKTDMEKMAKIIEDFVSEWDSLPLPPIQNGPERAVATAGNISQGRSREENTRPGSTEGQQ